MYFAKQTSRLLKQQVQSYQQLVKLTALNLSNYTCHDLSSLRSLVKITGQDSGKYLQNMLTNDINRLNEGNTRSIYSMVLNNRGRVLHDVLVYRINSLVQPTNEYLIEVDKAYLQDFLKMCQIYKIKKKVDISAVDSSFRLYSVTNDISTNTLQDLTAKEDRKDSIICVPDPRFAKLGYRVVSSNNEVNISEYFENQITIKNELGAYKQELYKRGIAENGDDISYGKSIPLEYNIVLLDGVSFDKGCYLGQELIAKTHHTGVVRKRIVPIEIISEGGSDEIMTFTKEVEILNVKSKMPAGMLKGLNGKYGIAMIRLSQLEHESLVLVEAQRIMSKQYKIKFHIPEYWKNDEKLVEIFNKFA